MPENSLPPSPRLILDEISPTSWEHPADRAALAALRRIPIFDSVLRAIFGLVGERPIRLAFQANAVRVSPRQFPRVHGHYRTVLETLDSPEEYELFVSQTPFVNAGAYGLDKPFIVLNSGSLNLLDDEELIFLLGHELGHILSGHVLYRTMTVLLLQLAQLGFPIVGLAARGVLLGLLEWGRKSELSADRAGLLASQNPDAVLHAMLKLAGGGTGDQTDLDEFMAQAEEYRSGGDVIDTAFKVLNLSLATHPFHVLRAAELRDWIAAGEYDRIRRGEYRRNDEPSPSYLEDLSAAMKAYAEDTRSMVEQLGDQFSSAAKWMRDAFTGGAPPA